MVFFLSSFARINFAFLKLGIVGVLRIYLYSCEVVGTVRLAKSVSWSFKTSGLTLADK